MQIGTYLYSSNVMWIAASRVGGGDSSAEGPVEGLRNARPMSNLYGPIARLYIATLRAFLLSAMCGCPWPAAVSHVPQTLSR